MKPIIRRFPGAEQMWPNECLYDTLDEAETMMRGKYERDKYIEFIRGRYSVEKVKEIFLQYV